MPTSDPQTKDHSPSKPVEQKAADEDRTAVQRFLSAIAPTPTEPDYSGAMYLFLQFIAQAIKLLVR